MVTANWTRLEDGSWGLRVSGKTQVGMVYRVTRKSDGKTADVKVTAILKELNGDTYCRASDNFDDSPATKPVVAGIDLASGDSQMIVQTLAATGQVSLTPATYSKSYDSMVKLILRVLEDNPTQWHSLDALDKHVKVTIGYSRTATVPVIRGLAAAGVVAHKGGFSSLKIQHKPVVVGDAESQAKIDELTKKYSKALVETTQTYEAKLKEQAALLETVKGGIAEVHLIDPAGETVKVTKGIFHEQFDHICDLVNAREEIFLWGPTGCGKSFLCKQVAETFGLRFAFVSCTSGMSEGVIGGRLLPIGKSGTFEYVISEFVDCYENGGVFLLDEIDAADPNVLLMINAALANGHMAIPNRPKAPYAIRHPDFVCIAAANTVGTGADRMYSGRNKLDAATLERFAIGKVLLGYDERVEAELCPDVALRSHLTKYRKAILAHGLERAMSTRFMIKAYKMVTEFGWTLDKVERAFFSGWRADEISKVKGGV